MKLFLGLPSAGAPAQPFIDSLKQLVLPADTSAFERAIVTGNFVPAQREVIFETALAWGADFIAMCDDDMVLPPRALADLCAVLSAQAAAALAGALYYSRDGLRPMVVEGWSPDDTRQGWIPAFDDRTPVAVDGVGFGCVIVRANAVRGFTRPFFATQIYVEHAARRVRVCNEDYLFCRRLRDAGYATILHPGVRCGHYDRVRQSVAPAQWESPQASSVRRVLAQRGEAFSLVPVDQAPLQTADERHVRADVVYVETS